MPVARTLVKGLKKLRGVNLEELALVTLCRLRSWIGPQSPQTVCQMDDALCTVEEEEKKGTDTVFR